MIPMNHVKEIKIYNGCLNVTVPEMTEPLPKERDPIHCLEKRLGILWTHQEIQQIRESIWGGTEGAFPMEVALELDDRDFISNMISVMEEKGTKFVRHFKNGSHDERFVLVRNGRLYWKEKQSDVNDRKRSIHLSVIDHVLVGKFTNAFRHRMTDHISRECCFSVTIQKGTLDLSSPLGDPVEVRMFTAYLEGILRHFKQRAKQMQTSRRTRDQVAMISGSRPTLDRSMMSIPRRLFFPQRQ